MCPADGHKPQQTHHGITSKSQDVASGGPAALMTVVKFLHSQIHLQAPQSPLLSGFENGRVQWAFTVFAASISLIFITEARPNILVFFPDELRFDWVNNGTDTDFLQTPNIDSIRERGVHFRRASQPPQSADLLVHASLLPVTTRKSAC
ncbi:Alkaline-phosphatase-like, core domain [Phytophthora cactorum]|nr:Alkaline-phosphatase-like, core domain [Phytophthora cactorum]